jgi:hypothetical protein
MSADAEVNLRQQLADALRERDLLAARLERAEAFENELAAQLHAAIGKGYAAAADRDKVERIVDRARELSRTRFFHMVIAAHNEGDEFTSAVLRLREALIDLADHYVLRAGIDDADVCIFECRCGRRFTGATWVEASEAFKQHESVKGEV